MQRGSGHGGANGADVKAQWTCERAARGIIFQECARAKLSQRMLAPEIKRYLALYFETSQYGETLPDVDGAQYFEVTDDETE